MEPGSVEQLLGMLNSTDPKARAFAVSELGTRAKGSDEVLMTLLDELMSAKGELNETVALAIHPLRADYGRLLPCLLDNLRLPADRDRETAARRLNRLFLFLGDEVQTPDVLEKLVVAASDPNEDVRRWIYLALGDFRMHAPITVPVLLRGLAEPKFQSRRAAAAALGALGGAAMEAVEPLSRLFRDPNPLVRRRAVLAVSRICTSSPDSLSRPCRDPESGATVRARLLPVLADEDPRPVLAALKAFGALHGLTEEETAGIHALREHADPEVRSLSRTMSTRE